MMLQRIFEASPINAVLNDPEVRPWIADAAAGHIDVSKQLENRDNICLMGEHGGVVFIKIMAGVYEVHTQVKPAGRGQWALDMVKAAQSWLFGNTDAYEILTRIPETHKAALGLAIKAGMTHEFTRENGVTINGVSMPVHVYRVGIYDWVKRADGIARRGAVFHQWLNAEAAKIGLLDPHGEDANHNRYVGATLEMMLGGQIMKAVLFYNRWASIARHSMIALVAVDPPTVNFDIGQLKLSDGTLEFVPWKPTVN